MPLTVAEIRRWVSHLEVSGAAARGEEPRYAIIKRLLAEIDALEREQAGRVDSGIPREQEVKV